MAKLDIKTIREQITSIDIMLRPCALFINPSRMSELKESIPDIEEKILIIPSEMVQDDIAYLIDRKKITKITANYLELINYPMMNKEEQ